MKKAIFFLLFAPLLISCKSNEDKIHELIREQMFKTLYDYQSYEPIETKITETLYAPENDPNYIDFIKIYTEAKEEGKIGQEQEESAEETSNGLLNLQDSVYKELGVYNTIMGYIVTHRFRCKNRGGVYDLVTKKLFIDKEIKNIIWQYEIDKKNSVDLNILSFLLKWEAHKAEMKLLQEYKEENLQYLKDNKTKEGVICTESGLQYKILEEGKGETPSPKDYVSFTLKSSFIDGTIFNEIKKPFNVRTDLVIKGLSEALTRMPLGSKWIIYVPSDLGYGSNKVNNIKPYSTLIYEVHLVGIGKQP